MKYFAEILVPFTLVVLAIMWTYSFSQMNTFSNAYGLLSPKYSNQDAITLNDSRPSQSQDVDIAIETNALLDDLNYIRSNDVVPISSMIVINVNKDSVKSFQSKDDYVKRSNPDAGAFNQTSANCSSEKKNAVKSPNMSRAKNCECDAGTSTNTLAQFNQPDLPEKLTQAGDLPQTPAISNTIMISGTCGLKEWCELYGPLKFKFNAGVTILEIPELSQKDLNFNKNALELTLKPTSAAVLRDDQATQDILSESYTDCNQVLQMPNNDDKMCFNSQLVLTFLEDQDICLNFNQDCFMKKAASATLSCRDNSDCEQTLSAAASKKPKIDLNLKKQQDSATEPVAKRSNYDHCKCYKAKVLDALTKSNQSGPFVHKAGPFVISLENDLLSQECGLHDWNQLCGTIVFKNGAQDDQIQLEFKGSSWQEHASTHSRGRRLQVFVPSGQCTGPPSNYNLLNTDVVASQSYGWSGYNTNANQGCDGVLQLFNAQGDIVHAQDVDVGALHTVSADPAVPDVLVDPPVWFWVATFQQTTNVQSILFIERWLTQNISFLVGDDPSNNFQNNPICIGGQLTAGGWLDCARQGKYLALTSTKAYFHLMEVMCYTQYFVHHNALSSTLSSTLETPATYLCTISTNCQASNVLRTTLVIWNNIPNYNLNDPLTPCCIYSQIQTGPTLKVTIPAELMIECVIITPSNQELSDVYSWQQNIEVYIVNSSGEKQLCGTLSDYNSYTEVPCKKFGNQIIITRPGNLMTLSMAGASILSNCDCSLSSLNPALISRAPNPLASPTTISTTTKGVSISIKLNKQMPDTVSSVCGNADGFTKCGLRSLVFTDKTTGFQITFPYKGFELNSDQSVLTLDPAKATLTSVLTVTVKLDNYPQVTYTQEITVIDEQPAPVAVQPLRIPNMALNATIDQEAFLDLPKLEASYIYVVVSKQKFEASVDVNQLKVFSKIETDVGTYYLDLVAQSQKNQVPLQVKVILALPTSIDTKTQTNQIQKEGNTATTTPKTKGDHTESIVKSDEETENLLETAACIVEESNEISCLLPNGFSFSIDGGSEKTVLGQSKKKASGVPPKLPKLTISKVNNKGQFYLKFSEPVGFQALNISASESRLKSEGGSRSSAEGNSRSESNRTLLNQLSTKHLNLTIKSENTTAAVFSWHAQQITSTQIMIQLELQDPLFISTQAGVLDKLIVKILPPALKYMRSLATGLMTEDPLRTVSRELPPQVMLGAAVETVEASSDIMKGVGQSSGVTNIVVQTLLSGSMTQMWSIVNALQIIMSQQYLNLQNPGNVIIVMTKLSDISSFQDVLPTDEILQGIFDFTPTDPPGMGFECMGVDNVSVTMYQGMTFLILILIGLLYLAYSLAYTCRLYDRLMSKIEQKLKHGLCFGLFYLFLQESYLDWAIGSFLRLEQPKFDTPSDYFDFGLACAGILITLVFPCYCFFFLKKNVDKLDQKDFKSKHGALYEGFTTDNADRRQASMKMAAWFLLRRFLTAVNVVYLRHQTIWIQLTLNMWLSLTDVCFKIHLSPYRSKVAGFMEKFNDLFVLTCAYYPYLFTDLIPSPEDKYFIGWFYDGTVGTLIAANLFVMVKTAFHGIIIKIKEKIIKAKTKKATEARNANREKREKMLQMMQSSTVGDLISVKPRANQLKNGLRAIHEVSLEQFLAMKRMEHQQKRDARLAQQLGREMDQELADIPEVDEENQGSNRAVRNDLEVQIIEESQVPKSFQTDVNQVAAQLISERRKFGLDKEEHQKQVFMFNKEQMIFEKQKLLQGSKKLQRQQEEKKQQPWDVETHIKKFSQELKDQEEKKIAQARKDEIKQRQFIRNQQEQQKDEEFNQFWRKYKKQNAIERGFFEEERKEINKTYLQRESQRLSLNQSQRFTYELNPDWKTSKPNWKLQILAENLNRDDSLQ